MSAESPRQEELNLFELNSATYTIKLNTDKHAIDAGVLGDVLLSYTKSIQAVSAGLRDCQEIKINVTTVESGCVEIHSVINVLQSVLNPETIPMIFSTLKNIVDLYRFLKGQPPKAVEPVENGNFMIKNCDHLTMTVHQTIYNGYATAGTPPFGKGYGLKKEGVQSVQVLDEHGVEQMKVEEEDFPSMVTPSTKMENPASEDVVVEAELVVETIPIGTPKKKWGFIHNGQKIKASIKDLEFIEKIAGHKISFSQGDRIKGRLSIHREFDPVMQCLVVKGHQLLDVIEYIPASSVR